MDDVYHRASYRSSSSGSSGGGGSNDGYSRPQQPRYNHNNGRPGVGSSKKAHHYDNNGSSLSSSSYFTGQNFGVIMSILVIYFFQRKDGMGRVLSARRDRGTWNALMDWLLDMHDYVIESGQMITEVFRNLRCHLLAHGDEWFHDLSVPASPMSASSLHAGSAGFGGPRGGGRARRNGAVSAANGRMAASQLPELEETDVNKLQKQYEGMMDNAQELSFFSFDKENTDPLEPAFLRDEDYPPGWLVFDPVLGVVSKAEADRYRRGQNQKNAHLPQKEQQQQLLPQQQPKSPVQQQPPPPPQNLHPKQPATTPQQLQQHTTMMTSNTAPPSRALRTQNVMPQATSAMHTPHTITANG